MPVPISYTHAQFCLRGYPTELKVTGTMKGVRQVLCVYLAAKLEREGGGGGGKSGMAFRSHSYCLAMQGAVADVC